MAIYKLTKTNETRETVYEKDNVKLHVSFYWDSHGKLVPWQNEKGHKTLSRRSASVKIVKRNVLLDGMPFENWELYVNGERINGDVYKYTGKSFDDGTSNLRVAMALGWG